VRSRRLKRGARLKELVKRRLFLRKSLSFEKLKTRNKSDHKIPKSIKLWKSSEAVARDTMDSSTSL